MQTRQLKMSNGISHSFEDTSGGFKKEGTQSIVSSSTGILLGNDWCHGGTFNTKECGWDDGDCIEFNEKYPNCTAPRPEWVGNSECNDYPPYNTTECGFDGGDCTYECSGMLCNATEEKAIIGVVAAVASLGLFLYGFRRRQYVVDAFAYFTSSMLRKK
ncbi:hypothetical protein CTEN210_12940 [Chaetoceros tenuissimus]|uniref:LNR domain-containing protein n=1 Tax=Chaetoceros tenuissimus TaxID=426638 RepID=A0AAD3HAZ2_9STRA|nr:hypothetical protein CTEN210_12940 [Chaetoceros tenuissimus]